MPHGIPTQWGIVAESKKGDAGELQQMRMLF
jgi:hypothetical protein